MSDSKVPSNASFDLTLTNQLEGTPVLKNPVCEYHYDWNFETNTGIAMLRTINGSPVNILLHPLGIAGSLDFMSDMEPTTYTVSAEPGASIALIEVVIYRAILDISLASGDRSAAIMFNEDGSSIVASAGFSAQSTKRALPEVQLGEQ